MASNKHTPIFRVWPCFRFLTFLSPSFRYPAFHNDVCVSQDPRCIRHTVHSGVIELGRPCAEMSSCLDVLVHSDIIELRRSCAVVTSS